MNDHGGANGPEGVFVLFLLLQRSTTLGTDHQITRSSGIFQFGGGGQNPPGTTVTFWVGLVLAADIAGSGRLSASSTNERMVSSVAGFESCWANRPSA